MAKYTKVGVRIGLEGIDLSGPFFERDPAKTVRENIGELLDKLRDEGQEAVRSEIAGRSGEMPGYSGWSYNHTIGRRASYSGRHWALSVVVSANTDGMSKRDAIRTKAAAATIEKRWHLYKRLSNQAGRSRAVLAANLTKGIE